MPLFQGTELEDGRYLGLTVREVTALPHMDVFGPDSGRMGQVFEGLLGDLARLCGESAALELLWLSEPVSGQRFPARVRLFLLLRKLSATAAQTEREMDAFLSAMEAVLTQKGCSLSGGEALTGLLEQAEGHLHALVRQEKVPMSFFAQFPYYHYDTLQGCAVDFASLLTALCGAPGASLSVQVIPAALSPEEQFAAEQMRQMLAQAVSGMPGQPPIMGDDTARRPLETYTYYAQDSGPRFLMNLLEQNASIYDTIHTIPLDDLLSKPTVLELNAIENQEQKALLMALLLISVCTHTKQNQKGDGELKNIILIDEAHVLLGGKSRADGAGGQDTTVRALQNMIAEIRSYGTGILIADQSPTAVSRPIVANTNIKVSFRLVQGEEKSALADSTGMEETQRQHLGRLGVGEAFVYYSRLDAPQLVKTTDSRAAKGIRLSVPDGEIAGRMTYWTHHGDLLKPCRECGLCSQCAGGCNLALRDRADYYAARVLQENGVKMKDRSTAAQYVILMHKPLALWEGTPGANFERLCFCTRLRLLRKIALEKGFVFTPREMETILLPRKKGE